MEFSQSDQNRDEISFNTIYYTRDIRNRLLDRALTVSPGTLLTFLVFALVPPFVFVKSIAMRKKLNQF